MKVETLRAQFSKKQKSLQNVDTFIGEVKRFTDVTELDKNLLHRLIRKITIGSKYEANGVKKQNITIEYRFVGQEV